MRCVRWLLVAVFVALPVANVWAVPTPAPASATLQDLINITAGGAANGIFSQDKLFYNFTYTTPAGSSAGPASNVFASLIFQSASFPETGVDIHGWNFSSSQWAQIGATPAEFTLGFTIQVFDNVNPGAKITGADATYAPVSVVPTGFEIVNWSNGATVTLTSGSPGPLPSNGNIGFNDIGPITASAHFLGTGAITQTSLRFYETITPPPVPVPPTVLLLGSGLLGLIGVRRLWQKGNEN